VSTWWTDLVTSSTAAGGAEDRQGKRTSWCFVSGAASTRITNEDCKRRQPCNWTYDTYALSNGTAKYVVKNGGKDLVSS